MTRYNASESGIVQSSSGYSSYEFGELDFLGALEAEDYLTINLLNNQDAGNILWEWAFESLSIDSVLLDDDQLADDGTLVISADELPLVIRAIRFGGDKDAGPQVLTWDVLAGDAEIAEGVRQTDDGNGVWTSTLAIEPVAGNEVILEGRLGDDESSAATMRKVYITPGEAADIHVRTSGQAYMLGVGQTDVTITVRDKQGNAVADGTPVALHISEGGIIQYEELSTVNGIATAVVVGGENPASGAELTARVFDAPPGQATIDILPLSLSIAGLSDTHFRGEQSTVTATVTAGGSPAAGVAVDLVASHGIVDEYTAETNAQGQVQVPVLHLRPGEGARLSVTIGVDISQSHEYTVAYKDDGKRRIESVETMVLGDQVNAGALQHERYDDVSITYDYATQSPFDVQGAAGANVSISLGDLSDPNLAPMAAWQ